MIFAVMVWSFPLPKPNRQSLIRSPWFSGFSGRNAVCTAYHEREALELSFLLPAAHSDPAVGIGRVHMIQAANQPEHRGKHISRRLRQAGDCSRLISAANSLIIAVLLRISNTAAILAGKVSRASRDNGTPVEGRVWKSKAKQSLLYVCGKTLPLLKFCCSVKRFCLKLRDYKQRSAGWIPQLGSLSYTLTISVVSF